MTSHHHKNKLLKTTTHHHSPCRPRPAGSAIFLLRWNYIKDGTSPSLPSTDSPALLGPASASLACRIAFSPLLSDVISGLSCRLSWWIFSGHCTGILTTVTADFLALASRVPAPVTPLCLPRPPPRRLLPWAVGCWGGGAHGAPLDHSLSPLCGS